MENLKNASLEELTMTDEVGEITAKSIDTFFRQEQTVDLLERLEKANVNMEELEAESEDKRFEGMTFVLTGALEQYTREEASKIIESFGGKISSSVSKKTTYVIAGEEARKQTYKSTKFGCNSDIRKRI